MSGPALAARELAIGYRPGRRPARRVAEGITVAVQPGELVALLGPNGAGKSTLIRTLAGMQAPLAGEVELAGRPLARLAPRERARLLSVVLTDRTAVGALTVEGLVALGRQPHTDWTGRLTEADWRVLDEALAAVGAAALRDRFVDELSDGERQKVMVARALAQEPAVLILDEPTAFLDLPHKVELLQLLRRLARETGRALIVATHDLELALRVADRLWLLPVGGPLSVGAPEDLVLSGDLAATFDHGGVRFDPLTGAFASPVEARDEVAVRGEGVRAVWCRRALERQGHAVVDEAPTVIEVGEVWTLHRAGESTVCPTLAALLEALDG